MVHLSFLSQFECFSRALGEAAVQQQKNIRDTFVGLAHQMSGCVMTNNLTWPCVTLPLCETHAHDALIQANVEFMATWNRAFPDEMESFVNFTTAHCEEVNKEGHMMRQGNLDRLVDDHSMCKPFVS